MEEEEKSEKRLDSSEDKPVKDILVKDNMFTIDVSAAQYCTIEAALAVEGEKACVVAINKVLREQAIESSHFRFTLA